MLTLGDRAATASTQRWMTGITSSHSPSMLVNIAFVSLGSPLSRTIRTASATSSPTDSPAPSGVIENAASTAHLLEGLKFRTVVSRYSRRGAKREGRD